VSTVGGGTPDDVASWLELAREVEPLFGPMPPGEYFPDGPAAALASGSGSGVRDGLGSFA